MIPVVIPTSGGDCFAMYGAASGALVLFCPPIGDECRKTARLWRDLAVRLQEHGVASLRVDLPGTGNSAGEPSDPDLVGNWRAAIRACAEWAKRRHGGRVILFGYRFGALLALDAATEVSVERLVLLDPPASGSAAARYIRSRARLEAAGPLPEGPEFIQAGGMPLSEAALAAISTLPAPIGQASVPAAPNCPAAGTRQAKPLAGPTGQHRMFRRDDPVRGLPGVRSARLLQGYRTDRHDRSRRRLPGASGRTVRACRHRRSSAVASARLCRIFRGADPLRCRARFVRHSLPPRLGS